MSANTLCIMISSSTAAAVPLPRWGRLGERLRAWENGAFVTQINQNLHLSTPLRRQQKNHRTRVGGYVILSVSRVLSGTVIYLRLTSPPSFGLRRATRGYMSGRRSSYGVASNRVYSKCMLPYKWVSSYLAFPSLPLRAVYFCCTFPVVAYG